MTSTISQEFINALEANGAIEIEETHSEFFERIQNNIINTLKSYGKEPALSKKIFRYVLQHHLYDLNTQKEAELIIVIICEMAAPHAEDDSNTKEFLLYLQKELTERTNEL